MGHIVNGYGIMVVFNCRKCPPGNRASQVTLHDLESAGTETVSRSSNLQLASHSVHNQVAM